MNKANLKSILKNKADYPVRMIALEDVVHQATGTILCKKGNEVGIEVIDFLKGV